MPTLFNMILVAAMLGYGVLLIIDVASGRHNFIVGLQVIAFLFFFLILHFSTGFPSAIVTFGPSQSYLSVFVVFSAVIAGILAQHLFFTRDPFSWLALFRPIIISPMVLLPLLGTLQNASQLQPIQWASITCIAFQNGFFWKTVLKDVAKRRK